MGHAGAPAGWLYNGTVTRVTDGDTLEIDGVQVRLALLDTPEVGEDGYGAALNHAASLCPVGSAASYDADDGQPGGSHGRIIAEVFCGGTSLNRAIIEGGHGTILTGLCHTSEFASSVWASDECGRVGQVGYVAAAGGAASCAVVLVLWIRRGRG